MTTDSASTAPVSKPSTSATKAAAPKKATATKKAAGTKKAAAPKSTGSHPSWKEIIKECIADHPQDARSGVSRSTIKKFAETKYKIEMNPAALSQLNRAIAHGASSGTFALPKGPSGKVKLAPKVKADASKENAKPASPKTTKTASKPAPAAKKAAPAKKPAAKAAPTKKAAPAKKASTTTTKKAPASSTKKPKATAAAKTKKTSSAKTDVKKAAVKKAASKPTVKSARKAA